MVGQEPLEGLTGVLAFPIRVMQERLRLTGPRLRPRREPAFGGPERGEVGDPFAMGRRGRKCPVEYPWRAGVSSTGHQYPTALAVV